MASSPGTRLGAFALATFHTVLLVWLFVVVGFRDGSLGETLEDIGTAAGLPVFGVIWAVVGVITFAAIVRLPNGTASSFGARLRAGAGTAATCAGLLLLTVAAVGAIVSPFVVGGGLEERAQAVGVFVFYFGLLGGLVAFAVGGLLGLVLALVDSALLAVSRWIAPDLAAPRAEEPVAPTTTADEGAGDDA